VYGEVTTSRDAAYLRWKIAWGLPRKAFWRASPN
jgi:hypothetical protein